VKHAGGCHCGRVRFEVTAPAKLEVVECNCSICGKSGYLHLIVPAERFRLISGADALSTYSFNTLTAKHLFCATCGVKSFYVPRSHPDGFSVNARCLDAATIEAISVSAVNGREWEAAYPQGRGSY
jgi:hypothetical protein